MVLRRRSGGGRVERLGARFERPIPPFQLFQLLPNNLLVRPRVPLWLVFRVGDFEPEVEDQLYDPGFFLSVDLGDLVAEAVVVRMGPVEEKENRDAFAG